MAVSFTDDDEGKTVKNAAGDDIGMIKEVRGETAYVDPDPGLTDQLKASLGWGDSDQDTYALQSDRVERVEDDAVWLSERL